MIDLGLSKLMVIGTVALIVIGPEKLPRVARMAGSLFGRAQRYLNQVKAEVSREIELEELRKMQQEVHQAAASVGQSIAEGLADAQGQINDAWRAEDKPFDAPQSDRAAMHLAGKARDFRRKKLMRTSAVPQWYKQQSGKRSRVTSAAARVAKYRPAGASARFFQ